MAEKEADHKQTWSVNWSQFYQAIQNDDSTTVAAALNAGKDFRFWALNNCSYLDLAIRQRKYTITKLIFQSDLMENLPRKEKVRILTSALTTASEEGCVSVFELILNEMRCLNEADDFQLLDWVKIDDLHNIVTFTLISENDNDIIPMLSLIEGSIPKDVFVQTMAPNLYQALRAGPLVIDFVMKNCDISVERLHELTKTPYISIYCALKDLPRVKMESESMSESEWREEIDKIGSLDNVHLLDIAIHNDFLDGLKYLYSVAKEKGFKNEVLLPRLGHLSLQRNRFEIVEWLAESVEGAVRKPYEGSYSFQPGEVFRFLCDKFPVSEDFDNATLCVELPNYCENSRVEIIHYYFSILEEFLDDIDMQSCLEKSIRNGNVDVTLFLLSKTESREVNFDQLLKDVMLIYADDITEFIPTLPSLPLLEIVLNTASQRDLATGTINLKHTSATEWIFSTIEPEHRFKEPFEVICRHIENVMYLLHQRGFRVGLKVIDNALKDFFKVFKPNSYMAARLIVLADYYDLLKICPLGLVQWGDQLYQSPSHWFVAKFNDRDAFIVNLLKTFCSSRSRTLQFDGFLSYILHPDERFKQFSNCIEQFGLRIEDKCLSKLSQYMQQSRKYEDAQKLTQPNDAKLSLLSLSRLSIYRQLRKKANSLQRHYKYSTVSMLVNRLCSEHLPESLGRFLRFEDVFKTWKWNLDPRMETAVVEVLCDDYFIWSEGLMDGDHDDYFPSDYDPDDYLVDYDSEEDFQARMREENLFPEPCFGSFGLSLYLLGQGIHVLGQALENDMAKSKLMIKLAELTNMGSTFEDTCSNIARQGRLLSQIGRILADCANNFYQGEGELQVRMESSIAAYDQCRLTLNSLMPDIQNLNPSGSLTVTLSSVGAQLSALGVELQTLEPVASAAFSPHFGQQYVDVGSLMSQQGNMLTTLTDVLKKTIHIVMTLKGGKSGGQGSSTLDSDSVDATTSTSR